jgi:hypothetical protein
MPIPLALMREQLLPGLMEVANSPNHLLLDRLFNKAYPLPLPEIGIGTAVAIGVAAAVIKNPTVSRRGLLTVRK